MATPNFTSYFAKYDYDGAVYHIKKGPSGYGKYYVLDADGKTYLSKGAASLQGAQMDMVGIHNQRKAANA